MTSNQKIYSLFPFPWYAKFPVNFDYDFLDRKFDKCVFNVHHNQCIVNTRRILNAQNFLQCNCLPACTSITLESEVYTAELNMSSSFGGHEFDLDKFSYSQISFYFKENSFLTSQRVEYYGPIDFLATCGGLLGLFLGVSVISLLELIYFCTIRLYMNMQLSEELDHGRTELVEEFQRPNVSKTRRCLKLLKQLIADYFNKTTIQGVNYLAETKVSVAERLWWAIFVALSTFCCGSLISNIIRQYEQSPVIISYANEETPISEVSIHFHKNPKSSADVIRFHFLNRFRFHIQVSLYVPR
jgi:Amiloride-sensitive sodium channel